jgi:hypothetical protein
MIDVDMFLDRVPVPARKYTCLSFVLEVWKASFGEDVSGKFYRMLGGACDLRGVALEQRARFTKLEAPVSPCFVLMWRINLKVPHIGIWYNGRILHLHETGAQYMSPSIVTRRFQRVSYFV